jgi:16S rRNA processing protein RimM
MSAVSPEGVPLGAVTALHNFGAGDLIEIATIAGGEPLLLPFTETVVPKIDMVLRQVVIVLPTLSE